MNEEIQNNRANTGKSCFFFKQYAMDIAHRKDRYYVVSDPFKVSLITSSGAKPKQLNIDELVQSLTGKCYFFKSLAQAVDYADVESKILDQNLKQRFTVFYYYKCVYSVKLKQGTQLVETDQELLPSEDYLSGEAGDIEHVYSVYYKSGFFNFPIERELKRNRDSVVVKEKEDRWCCLPLKTCVLI